MKLKSITATILAAVILASTAAAEWTPQQYAAHDIANTARAVSADNPVIPAAKQMFEFYTPRLYTTEQAVMLAKLVYGEARGTASQTEQAAVMWTVLNRVDAGYGRFEEVITSPHQFAYRANFPTTDDYGRDLYALAVDVLSRWQCEQEAGDSTGRALPADYLWYSGDGRHNYFRNAYSGGAVWDYSMFTYE